MANIKTYPSKTPINVRTHHAIFFGNVIIFIGGFAFFMEFPIAGHYGLELLCMLAYFAISCFALFVYFTHSAGQYTIRQSFLITMIHLTEPAPRKKTVAQGFTIAMKEDNNV